MELYYSIRPLLAVLVSLCAVPFIVLSPRPNIRETVSFIAAGLKFALVISMLPVILNGHQIIFTLMNVLPGAPIQFRVDALGMLFGIVSSFLWIVTTTYSIGYMRGLDEHAQTRYFCFFAIALSATIGVAFAANLLTLYTYPLVTHHQDDEARISGRKYLTYILGTSIGFVLPAMLYVYHVTGTLNFSALGILGKAAPHSVLIVILFLFIFGFAKSAIMPFHAWLPAAMVVVKVGVFSIIRVLLYTFGTKELMGLHVGPAVSYVASFTIIIGSLIALSQDNLKRLLAYSTISQLSYIILGVALLSPRGMTGGLIHIPMHAFGKITLFFCAGAIFVATGKKNLSEMHGIGKRMPITMIAFFIASLSIIGLPPCGGFLSKWNLLLGSLQSHQAIALVVLLVSSLLNAAYFMPIIYKAFFLRDQGSAQGIREAPLFCVVPLCVTSLLSIAMFFYPQPFYKLIKLVIHQLLRA
ncbi:MAG: monovalent cation/H+ antiporter subunit D family protein [Deltaproteobacteria bacterium]|nr:monovalent cation/H+ antiporter subunit D family protein [Deltaproteobacteria bacterium]